MALLITTGFFQVIVFAQCFCSSFSTTFPRPARVNVALHKMCNMSSNYNGFQTGCGAAVNGDTSATYSERNCIHTATNDTHPRWTVFLGQNYLIVEIVVYMRDVSRDDKARWENISLLIDDVQVFHRDADTRGTIRVPSPPGALNETGRSVTVARDGQDGNPNSFLLNVCEVQVWAAVCLGGKYPYGDQCLSCGHCANNDLCNNFTGHCPNGCKSGYEQTPTCHTTCDPHHFGDDCQQICSAGSGGHGACDKISRNCTSPTCNPGYRQSAKSDQHESHVTESYLCEYCSHGTYGSNCSRQCGAGCTNKTCDNEDGTCSCITDQWEHGNCTECARGHYGPASGCQNRCGSGCMDDTCNPDNGNCLCKNGWQPPLCTACENGRYGKNCNQTCGHCKEDVACERQRGHCPSCSPGWVPPLCQQQCKAGQYGQNCREQCGHCLISPCNATTGECSATCEEGFTGALCKQCQPCLWGENCSWPCGQCGGDRSCDMATGQCLAEQCLPGWKGTRCLQQLPQTSDPATSVIGIAAGVSGAVLLIIVIVVVIVIVMRRRRHGKPNNAEEDRYTNDSTQADTGFSEIKGDQHNSNTNERGAKPKVAVKPRVANRQDGTPSSESTDHDIQASDSSLVNTSTDSPLYGNIPQKLPTNNGRSGDKRPSIPIKPIRAAPLYENIPMDFSPRDQKQEQDNTSDEAAGVPKSLKKNRAEEEIPEDEERDVYNKEDLYACYRSLNSLSMIDSFQKYLLDCLASPEKLSEEFQTFPRGMPHPHMVGSDPVNNKKNRFHQLCAYDKNRVILRRPAGDTDTDYINASYIKGYQNDQAYIATQGPRANMINDLWWMIWQEEATQIVMLTNLEEDGKSKCDQYWPEPGTTVSYGHVTVTTLEEDERADFVIRTFIVKAQEDTERSVQHYHYMAWPDHGVPTASSLVDFWQYVTAQATTDMPPIIHCSAGVGRTGTYIALNIAIDRKSHGLDVSVNDIVSELREQRSIMVQTEVQYRFLHEVILEAYTTKDTRMSIEILDVKFPTAIDVNKPNKTIDNEFKLLEEMKQWAKPHHTVAKLEENFNKNRDPDILPDDNRLVYLSEYVRGRNQYINATFLSSYRHKRGLLLTQLPLPHTLVDLWRLVDSCDVNTIVSLGGKEDKATVKDFCQYWPKTIGEDLRTGPYTLSLALASISMEHLTTFHVNMTKTEKDDSRPVTILHYTDWSGQLPGNSADVLHLVEILNSTIKDSTAPVIIQCQDGASRSGLFSVLYDISSRMTSDEAVNVLNTVRHLHSVTPHAVTSQTEYRYCYRMAQEVRQNLRVYANT